MPSQIEWHARRYTGGFMSFKSDESCVRCGVDEENYVCYHHLYTQGAYPALSQERWNMISLCQRCHNVFHDKPLSEITAKSADVSDWLIKNNWYFSAYNLKWEHDK